MLDVNPVRGFPGKQFHRLDEAELNQSIDYHGVAAALDRLDTALARIAHARIAHAQQMAAQQAAESQHDASSGGRIVEPQWAEDMANRLDSLIGELRRTLSGDPA